MLGEADREEGEDQEELGREREEEQEIWTADQESCRPEGPQAGGIWPARERKAPSP